MNIIKKHRNSQKKQEHADKSSDTSTKGYSYCGKSHPPKKCPAFGKECGYCHKVGHYASCCRKKAAKKKVNALEKEEGNDDSDQDSELLAFSIEETSVHNNWVAKLKIGDCPVSMKIDTGADCNVISKVTFHRLKIDKRKLRKSNVKLKVYDGRRLSALWKVELTCEYENIFKVLEFNVVEQNVPSVLGLPGIEELKLVKRVFNLKSDGILGEFGDVFKGLGAVKGAMHTIRLKPDTTPVVHPPRRVPVALRSALKDELKRMEQLNVIERVEEPTDWVNSLVVVRKKNNKIRVCMDPSDLNRAIKREHYPMKTVEEVVARMSNAKIFSVLDANHGFWQISLDDASSKLCTFNTPFGRYKFKRLPFGICSAPEVFQKITR